MATTANTKAKTANQKAAKSGAASAEQAGEFAEDVVAQLQSGGQQAIGAVRSFLEKVDDSVAGSYSPSFVHGIADSALEMSDKMVEHGGDALRSIVSSGRRIAA